MIVHAFWSCPACGAAVIVKSEVSPVDNREKHEDWHRDWAKVNSETRNLAEDALTPHRLLA
jgi:hypothetical protein